MRAQLYVALDVGYLNPEQFARLSDLADKASRQIDRFIDYLESHPGIRKLREDSAVYDV